VLGLVASTGYQFQLVAYRGTLNVNAVFGGLSNVASGTTAASTLLLASVTVSPASATVTVGQTLQLVATLKDAVGSVLSGTVSWASSNSAVATVSGSGLVTGVAAGSATVTATSGGVTGSAGVAVTAPPPSSGGTWPNEPPGNTLINDYGFSDAVPVTSNPVSLGTSGWNAEWNPVGNGSLIPDNGAPFSPPAVYQVMYPTGFVAGSAPSTVYYLLSPQVPTLYWGFWWKPSNPFQSDASGVNKIAFLWTASGNTDLLYFCLTPGPWRIKMQNDLNTGGGPTAGHFLEPNVTGTTITLGQWHRIEIYVKYSTGSNADGIVEWWVDGVLNGGYTNLKMVQDGGFNEVSFSPTYGGTGSVKTETDYYWFDHTHLSKP
jgi:hypothetical protein